MRARWLRHAVSLPVVGFGAWYGVEHGSSGAFLLAGAGALAWLVWPEVSRFLARHPRRRTEVARVRAQRAVSRAEREVRWGAGTPPGGVAYLDCRSSRSLPARRNAAPSISVPQIRLMSPRARVRSRAATTAASEPQARRMRQSTSR